MMTAMTEECKVPFLAFMYAYMLEIDMNILRVG